MIYDEYTLASLVTLIGRAPDWLWSEPGRDREKIAQWYLADGRVVSFACLRGDNRFSVFQRENPPADETGQS